MMFEERNRHNHKQFNIKSVIHFDIIIIFACGFPYFILKAIEIC